MKLIQKLRYDQKGMKKVFKDMSRSYKQKSKSKPVAATTSKSSLTKWKRKMFASAFGEDQGCSSAPRTIGLFFLIASMSTLKPLLKEDTPKLNATNYQRDKAKVLTIDLDIGATLSYYLQVIRRGCLGNFGFCRVLRVTFLALFLELGL
ncbi:hypothetical protein Tco_1292453 [Tanacetum coccineum]